MSAPCPTATCDRPRPGNRHLCGACEADLSRALGDVPWLVRELDITLAKQGSHVAGGRSASVPLPYDPRATEAAWVLRSALVGWVRVLGESRLHGPRCVDCGHPSCWLTVATPADDLPAMAWWLLARVERLVMHLAAEEVVDEVCSAVRSATRLIDRPAPLWFAGPCDAPVDGPRCGVDLYARPDAPKVRCRECGAEYDVAARKAWMLDAIEDALFPAAHAAHVLTSLGWPCTGERIRQWASRGRVVAHGTDGQGRPVYRVGELRVLLVEAHERAGARQERMAV